MAYVVRNMLLSHEMLLVQRIRIYMRVTKQGEIVIGTL